VVFLLVVENIVEYYSILILIIASFGFIDENYAEFWWGYKYKQLKP